MRCCGIEIKRVVASNNVGVDCHLFTRDERRNE